MPKKFPTYRCKQSFSADPEFPMYQFEKGKTYTDNDTTVMDVYVNGGNWFEPAEPDASTITITHPEARRRR